MLLNLQLKPEKLQFLTLWSSRLQSRHKEIIYFQSKRAQEFLVLIDDGDDEAMKIMKPCSGFQLRTQELGIQKYKAKDVAIDNTIRMTKSKRKQKRNFFNKILKSARSNLLFSSMTSLIVSTMLISWQWLDFLW